MKQENHRFHRQNEKGQILPGIDSKYQAIRKSKIIDVFENHQKSLWNLESESFKHYGAPLLPINNIFDYKKEFSNSTCRISSTQFFSPIYNL